jgi:tryptophan synthase alpha chain
MSAIAEAFELCRAEKRTAFVPFLVAGDPTLEASEDLFAALVEAGADLIEVGVPFSDPIADGPTIQAAAQRALAEGATLDRILDMVARLRGRGIATPIVLFSYCNPILAYGLERFAEHAAECGVDGVLCVDLPPEEAEGPYLDALAASGLDPIFLLAPTSTKARILRVAEAGSGFVYYVSRAGVTGARESVRKSLKREVKALRRQVKLPIAVGFGVSTPEQVREVAKVADGVVVGSALVTAAGGCRSRKAFVEKARELAEATR